MVYMFDRSRAETYSVTRYYEERAQC